VQDLQQQKWQYLQEKEKSFTERPVPILAPITAKVAISAGEREIIYRKTSANIGTNYHKSGN